MNNECGRESFCRTMSDLTPQPLLDSVAALLAEANWCAVPEGISSAVRVEREGAAIEGVATLFEKEGERLLVVDFSGDDCPADPEELPEALFARYLDMSLTERLVLWGPCRASRAHFLFCASAEGCRLIDVEKEVPLTSCGVGPSEGLLREIVLPMLGKKGPERAQADSQFLARELECRLDLMCGWLGRALDWSRGDAVRLVRHLLLGYKRTILESKPEGCKATGFSFRQEDGVARVSWSPPAAAELTEALLRAANDLAPVGTGGFTIPERRALCRMFESADASVMKLPISFVRMSIAKLLCTVQLRVFLPTAREHMSWRLALTNPLRAEAEIESRDLYVFKYMEIDVEESGVGRTLEALEKLAAYALRETASFRRAGGRQLDMVEQSGEDEPSDPFNWLCRHALRLRIDPEKREALAYLVASCIVELRTMPAFADSPRVPLASLLQLFAPTPDSWR